MQIDQYLKECSDEKKARIILGLLTKGLDIEQSKEALKLWEQQGFHSLRDEIKRHILKVIQEI